jgi:antitoxin VapB
MGTARVFRSGNSQAVRLPKQYRLKSKEVEIFPRGDEIVLREKNGVRACKWKLAIYWIPTSASTFGRRDRKRFCDIFANCVREKLLFPSLPMESFSMEQ